MVYNNAWFLSFSDGLLCCIHSSTVDCLKHRKLRRCTRQRCYNRVFFLLLAYKSVKLNLPDSPFSPGLVLLIIISFYMDGCCRRMCVFKLLLGYFCKNIPSRTNESYTPGAIKIRVCYRVSHDLLVGSHDLLVRSHDFLVISHNFLVALYLKSVIDLFVCVYLMPTPSSPPNTPSF